MCWQALSYLGDAGTGASQELFRKKDHLSLRGEMAICASLITLAHNLAFGGKYFGAFILWTGAYQSDGASCGYRVLPHDSFVNSANHYLLSDRSAENAGKELEEVAKLVLSFFTCFCIYTFSLFIKGR